MSESLAVPQGTFRLARYPVRPREQLRAWDAADEYVLQHLAQLGLPGDGVTVVVNDESGALAVALAARPTGRVVHWGDSFVSQCATRANLAANGIATDAVEVLGSLDPLPARIDLLVVKVPKSLAVLDEQLRALRPSLHPGTVVLGAAMTRHLHTSTLAVFEQVVGSTRTTLAQRKARLVLATIDPALHAAPSRWPTQWQVAGTGVTVVAHAGAFAAERLDPGTEVLLDALQRRSAPAACGPLVVDLGCGTGVVGTQVALADPDASVVFVDESFHAVASAEVTFRASLGPEREARFVVGDCLDTVHQGAPLGAGTVDRVLVNPPFHSGHALTDAIAWDMFVQARRALRPGGDVWVVGNRHLGYHVKLKRIFGAADVVASTPGFVVLRAVRS